MDSGAGELQALQQTVSGAQPAPPAIAETRHIFGPRCVAAPTVETQPTKRPIGYPLFQQSIKPGDDTDGQAASLSTFSLRSFQRGLLKFNTDA